jgi:hypothetical protein
MIAMVSLATIVELSIRLERRSCSVRGLHVDTQVDDVQLQEGLLKGQRSTTFLYIKPSQSYIFYYYSSSQEYQHPTPS